MKKFFMFFLTVSAILTVLFLIKTLTLQAWLGSETVMAGMLYVMYRIKISTLGVWVLGLPFVALNTTLWVILPPAYANFGGRLIASLIYEGLIIIMIVGIVCMTADVKAIMKQERESR